MRDKQDESQVSFLFPPEKGFDPFDPRIMLFLGHLNFETVEMRGKELLTHPCLEMLGGGSCPPLSKHFKRQLL